MGIMKSRPILFPGQKAVNALVLALTLVLGLSLLWNDATASIVLFFLLALLFGVLMTLPIGGYLGGFFRHPLLRLRHLHLAYAGLGERLLALLLFLATLAALLLYGLDAKARAALWAPPLDQGTLFTQIGRAHV